MKTYEYGKSDTVLIQPVGKHELSWIENEVREIHSFRGFQVYCGGD